MNVETRGGVRDGVPLFRNGDRPISRRVFGGRTRDDRLILANRWRPNKTARRDGRARNG